MSKNKLTVESILLSGALMLLVVCTGCAAGLQRGNNQRTKSEAEVIESTAFAGDYFKDIEGIEGDEVTYVKSEALGEGSGRVPGPTDYHYTGVVKISDDLAERINSSYELEAVTLELDAAVAEYVEGKNSEWKTCSELSKDFISAGDSGNVYICGNELYFEFSDF